MRHPMKITVASGKGGTGKTTVSVNLATYLATFREVVLVDMDVEEPNSGLFIKAPLVHREDQFRMIPGWDEKQCILCGECQEVCNFNAVIRLDTVITVFPQLCRGCYACAELCPASALEMKPVKMGALKHFKDHALNFVESRLLVGEEQATPLISRTNRYVDLNFPEEAVKIYDAPPGTSCPVIEAARHADFVILVTEPTPFGLHDLKLAVMTMKQLHKEFGVVINRSGIGDDRVLQHCMNEGLPVLALLPNDRRIAELYSRGKLIHPEIPAFMEQMERIWGTIQHNFSLA